LDIPSALASASSTKSFAAKDENITGTLKWLVAATGAAAAAIVAGLQLTAIANLQPWAAIVAACGAVVALIAIGLLLLGATRVLAVQGPTVTELSNDELNAGILEPSSNLDREALPPLISWVHQRRMSLLGDAASITSLYTDGVVGAKRSLDKLRRGEPSKWGSRDLDPQSATDVAWLEAEYAAATDRVERIEDAASYWQRRKAYSDLIARVPCLLFFFMLGVLVFAIIPVWGRSSMASEIMAPLPAQIYVRDADVAGVPGVCPTTLSGQLVGGTLDKPIVVTVPVGSCPALKLTVKNDALIVVPDPSESPASNP